jgi:hypothetical protein
MEHSTGWQSWADGRIKKHDRDLYEGNGLPSITVRIDRVERFVNRATYLMTTILFLLVAAIFTGVVDVLARTHH